MELTNSIAKLSKVAELQPQAAFSALAKSLQFEWSYLQRILPNFDDEYVPIQDAVNQMFWPAVFAGTISNQEHRLFTLPARMGGMGVRNPVETSKIAFATSRAGTSNIVDAIKGCKQFSIPDHSIQMSEAASAMHKILQQNDEDKLTSVLATVDPNTRRAITRSVGSKSSSWLTVMPIALHHFDLSATEFRDSLALRYHRPLLKAPANCDGCGDVFNMTHALDCRKGGLVIQRHNEVRDALGDLASLAYKDVIREPIVQEANDACGIPSLVADLSIRGVWQSQTVALFDIRVIDTDAPSYLHRDVASILSSAEEEKKRKYNDAAEARRASFTPIVVSVDGVLGREAECFIQLLANKIAQKWKKTYAEVAGWIRARLSFAILRATNVCLRGCRTKWRSGTGFDDGAGLPDLTCTY